MPLNLNNIRNFFPTDLFGKIKSFFWGDKYVLYDWPFKFSAKILPALLFMMCGLCWGDQFFRNIDIDCERGVSYTSIKEKDKMMNDHCWNSETFLVVKGTKAYMRGRVEYPGITPHYRGTDEIYIYTFYKQNFICLFICMILTYLPHRFWKGPALKTINRLLEIQPVRDTPLQKTMVSYFLETQGFNSGLLVHYLLCKFSATVTPILQWFVVYGFIGPLYWDYGITVVNFLANQETMWPNPMDIVFPKFAKCEKRWSGNGGDIELYTAICQMPLNNMNQWTFLLHWWISPLVSLLNLITMLYTLSKFHPYCRNNEYKNIVIKAAWENVEKARTYQVTDVVGKLVTRQKSKKSVIKANISFSEWLVLDIMRKNLEPDEFREFIRELIVTKNRILQLVPVETEMVIQVQSHGLENISVIPNRDSKVYKRNPNEYVVRSAAPVIPLNSNAHDVVSISRPVKYERIFRPDIKRTTTAAQPAAAAAVAIEEDDPPEWEPLITDDYVSRQISFTYPNGTVGTYINPPAAEHELQAQLDAQEEEWVTP